MFHWKEQVVLLIYTSSNYVSLTICFAMVTLNSYLFHISTNLEVVVICHISIHCFSYIIKVVRDITFWRIIWLTQWYFFLLFQIICHMSLNFNRFVSKIQFPSSQFSIHYCHISILNNETNLREVISKKSFDCINHLMLFTEINDDKSSRP